MLGPNSFAIVAQGRAYVQSHQIPLERDRVQLLIRQRGRELNLRHADVQAVTALAATFNAIGSANLDLSQWSVLVAPDEPGRAAMQNAIDRFPTEGPWSVSPNIIPLNSLHSISGLLSAAFGCTGINLGVGGSTQSNSDQFFALLGLHANGDDCGAWLVFTQRESETSARAIALAVSAVTQPGIGTLTLSFRGPTWQEQSPLFHFKDLERLVSFTASSAMRWSLPGGGQLRIALSAQAERRLAA